MAKRLMDLMRSVDTVLDDRRRLARRERQLVQALNRALEKMGYGVVAAKGGGPRRRPRGRPPGRKPNGP